MIEIFLIEGVDYQVSRQNPQNSKGGKPNGFAIGKCADIRLDTINVYPREILTAIFRQRYPECHINS